MKKRILIICSVLMIGCLCGCSNKYIGKYEHNIEWRKDNEITRNSYAYIELTEDKKCKFVGYDIGNEKNKEEISGKYKIKNDIVYCYYDENDEDYYFEFYINDDKLCEGSKECNNYFVKAGSNIDNNLILEDE